MTKLADNVNPNVYDKGSEREKTSEDYNEDIEDLFDEREIFDLIRNINDPEHPLTLEELRVVEESNIKVDNKDNTVVVSFTPTIPHCSMATLIGKIFVENQSQSQKSVHQTSG
ncbi:hypothetical protein HF086_002455 [Spodoptera exigua]|uniref:MIP18 family-like domain-containing protein n=1 Tax=Spodoptera exigua TaxID=7107 RepID=A0A922MG87_SPOEX|nr:hypothetical protein HF086_002455 [Spodoptera exigua]